MLGSRNAGRAGMKERTKPQCGERRRVETPIPNPPTYQLGRPCPVFLFARSTEDCIGGVSRLSSTSLVLFLQIYSKEMYYV